MARKRKVRKKQVDDYRHAESKRLNNQPEGITPASEERKTQCYAYVPHMDLQLDWTGKAEHLSFEVDIVSLHIHERISTKAILNAVSRSQPMQNPLSSDQLLSDDQLVKSYQYEDAWFNRLILGDSLLVMNSLLVKERMANKVQMIYIDPPYGIKYSSNFQPRIDRRAVKDRDQDLTHKPEKIKAYRDTWKLGIHSYLTYLRDRLLLSRELLTKSGSIFVQINDENLHLVRSILDEVFGRENFVAVITFVKTSGKGGALLDIVNDFLLWYAKDKPQLKYRQLYLKKELGKEGAKGFQHVELPDGTRRRLTRTEVKNPSRLPEGTRVFKAGDMTSQGAGKTTFYYEFEGQIFHPGKNNHWKTNQERLERLRHADRLFIVGKTLSYVRYLDEIPMRPLTNVWTDTVTAGFGGPKLFVVQTNPKVVERCILMTTDPGDLVLDPTCGSGTTAYCAEKWGRRWITCDTSRVAVAIARQRLMTAKFDYYELLTPERGQAGGFLNKTVPHITLKSIAYNTEIDKIAASYQPQIDEALFALNQALDTTWEEWEVPQEADEEWPAEIRQPHQRFWALKRKKRKEINKSIHHNALQDSLYDRPKVKRGIVRVSGPFTVEAIPVPAVEDPSQPPIPQYEVQKSLPRVADRGGDYIMNMLDLLKQQGGVLFPGGKKLELQNLRLLNLDLLHAEADTHQNDNILRVALSFGPPYNAVTAFQVQEAIYTAHMNRYDLLIFLGFSFVHEAQTLLQKTPAWLQVHFAIISPDVLMGDLLTTTRASQIFTVFGQPDVTVKQREDDTFVVELHGVDIYDPLTGEKHSTLGEDVAAWFLDTNYDGMIFHICQAFFPRNTRAWTKLQRALKSQIGHKVFEQMRSTRSFPFNPGKHNKIATKVIDFRGYEVMQVLKLGDSHREMLSI